MASNPYGPAFASVVSKLQERGTITAADASRALNVVPRRRLGQIVSGAARIGAAYATGGATLALEAAGDKLIPLPKATGGRAITPPPPPPVPTTTVTRPNPLEAYVPPDIRPRPNMTSFWTPPVPIPSSSGTKAGGGRPGTGGLIEKGLDVLDRIVNRGAQAGSGSGLVATDPCPGRIKVGNRCVDPGAALPGGTPLVTKAGGATKMGAFGIPALEPTIVGEITRDDGSTGLVRRCPAKFVLGGDNLCYPKGSIPNNLRKWPKAAKPPVSAYDAKMMRKYGPNGSKRNSVKKLATTAGFSCKKK